MKLKSRLMDEAAVKRALMRISHEIVEKNEGTEELCLVGVKRRGVPLAKMLAANIKSIDGAEVPVGTVDITLYRDDLTETVDLPVSSATELPCPVENRSVIIVDDVIYTGRTVRAAIEALFEIGRPKSIRLAVLVDRGHREIPIRADYVGKNVPTSKDERVNVLIESVDGVNGVQLVEKE